jgi:hypothetical protein
MLAAHVEKFKKHLSHHSSIKTKGKGTGMPEFHWEAIEKAMRTSCPETTYSRTQMKNKKQSLSKNTRDQKAWDPWTQQQVEDAGGTWKEPNRQSNHAALRANHEGKTENAIHMEKNNGQTVGEKREAAYRAVNNDKTRYIVDKEQREADKRPTAHFVDKEQREADKRPTAFKEADTKYRAANKGKSRHNVDKKRRRVDGRDQADRERKRDVRLAVAQHVVECRAEVREAAFLRSQKENPAHPWPMIPVAVVSSPARVFSHGSSERSGKRGAEARVRINVARHIAAQRACVRNASNSGWP